MSRKPIMLHPDTPTSLACQLGSGVQAYLYGSVAKGTATEKSDLDIYLTGPVAAKVEERLMFNRPKVMFAGKVYSLHVIGPLTVAQDVFFAAQPEARRVY